MANSKMLNNKGFSVLEIIVSLSLFLIVVLVVNNFYSYSQKLYNRGSNMAELTQNARVCLDRLSRELRQAVVIVTNLPPVDNDEEYPPEEEIFFQDGHDISEITYIKYYLSGTDLMRSQVAYYFIDEPSTYVTYNSLDDASSTPEVLTLEERVVGEYFDTLLFWGESGLINVSLELNKNDANFEIDTKVYARN